MEVRNRRAPEILPPRAELASAGMTESGSIRRAPDHTCPTWLWMLWQQQRLPIPPKRRYPMIRQPHWVAGVIRSRKDYSALAQPCLKQKWSIIFWPSYNPYDCVSWQFNNANVWIIFGNVSIGLTVGRLLPALAPLVGLTVGLLAIAVNCLDKALVKLA